MGCFPSTDFTEDDIDCEHSELRRNQSAIC